MFAFSVGNKNEIQGSYFLRSNRGLFWFGKDDSFRVISLARPCNALFYHQFELELSKMGFEWQVVVEKSNVLIFHKGRGGSGGKT